MEYKRTDPVRVYAPPGANTTIPENLPPPGTSNPGLVKNLLDFTVAHNNNRITHCKSFFLVMSYKYECNTNLLLDTF